MKSLFTLSVLSASIISLTPTSINSMPHDLKEHNEQELLKVFTNRGMKKLLHQRIRKLNNKADKRKLSLDDFIPKMESILISLRDINQNEKDSPVVCDLFTDPACTAT